MGIPNYLEDGVADKLKILLKLKSQIDIGLYVEEVRKRGNQIKIGEKDYILSDFETFKKRILEEFKSASYRDFDDLVYRKGLTYDEIMDLLDSKIFPSQRIGYNLPPGIYEIIIRPQTVKHVEIKKVSDTPRYGLS